MLTSFAAGVNQAGRRFSGKALRSVEADPQLSMDVAALKLRRSVRQRPPKLAFANPTFYIPRLTGYPRWFAADAVSGQGKRSLRHALLFTQARQGGAVAADRRPVPVGRRAQPRRARSGGIRQPGQPRREGPRGRAVEAAPGARGAAHERAGRARNVRPGGRSEDQRDVQGAQAG
ncbi:hypothetical protein LUX57_20865 [Actinomadura madurae]|uniref:hypothetical protein n=1 Tax=Actinomadura madurae TaxID=1993 RepID=UPI0020D26185|nr:hypothetical protein [Actinomadura madurae]MCP9967269.1 hypothetical protein [Actinomadura madurae]